MKKLLLEAPILTQSGYGEHARLVFKSLMNDGNLKLFVNPLSWGATSWASSIPDHIMSEIDKAILNFRSYIEESKKQGVNPSFDTHVHVGIPSEYEAKAPHSICVTAGIETDRVSAEWLFRTHRGMAKLIVPSEHAKSGFTETSYEVTNQANNTKSVVNCGCPIDVVPYPAKKIEVSNLDFQTDTDFNFLSVALLGPRKNIPNMLDWFLSEFKNDNVGLILKTGRAAGGAIDLDMTKQALDPILEKHKDRKCKIYLLHGDLEESEVLSLYEREDVHAYITTTHGEGYGLPIFEAVCAGIPVVATNWSAHTEYLSGLFRENNKVKNKKLFAKVDFDLAEIPKQAVWKDILVEGSLWAYPKESSFRKQIRNVYKNYGMYKKWAASLQVQTLQNHDEKLVLDKMRESILSPGQSVNLTENEESVLVL